MKKEVDFLISQSIVPPTHLRYAKSKKGLSAVVSTVLIIVIVLVAIAIIWWVVLPLVRKTGVDNEKADISIITTEGYTVYDKGNETTFAAASVHIRRGDDKADLQGIQVIFNVDGDSHEHIVANDNQGVLEPNSARKYTFALEYLCTGDKATKTISCDEDGPESVKIAPLYD